MRLKSRSTYPPGQFQLLLPEIGMKQAIVGGFREVVTAFAAIVAKNPGLAQKNGWPTDTAGQENWLDDRECRRLIAQGYSSFVDFSTATSATGAPGLPVKKNVLGRVVEAGRATKAGIGVWLEMFGPDGRPVADALAEKRAAICATCPQNDTVGQLEDHFIAPVVNGIKFLYEMQRDIKLASTRDDELGVCRVCLCPLKGKIHAKLNIVRDHLPPTTTAKLPPHCWILSE